MHCSEGDRNPSPTTLFRENPPCNPPSLDMDPRPIPPSATDLERRCLESTIDQDLHSLSLASLTNSGTNSHSHSFSSISSVEYPRGVASTNGPHGTPRAASRTLSGGSGIGESPVSTEGHHVSAVTLADGVFGRKGIRGDGWVGGRQRRVGEEDEWDPERSLGRLVGELGRVMGEVSPGKPLFSICTRCSIEVSLG